MNFAILGIRVFLFALSTFGYLAFLHEKTKLKIEFLPAVTFTIQICILFIAGILNLLSLAVGGIFLLGLLLAARSLKNRRQYQDFCCIGYVFFTVLCLYFLFMLKGQVFNSYDNFSHWALVVKQMLLTNRFPTWQDEIILFQSYPLGSSVFVYYVSKIISTVSEGCQMFAQTMLILSMILPLFAFVKKNKAASSILIGCFTIFILSYSNPPNNLLVDTLLPMVGVAGFILLEEELSGDSKSTWFSIPFAVSAILIKNSGIFFWALMAVRVLFYWIKNRKNTTKEQHFSWGALFLIPLSALLLWKKHVEYVFAAGMTSMHSMSLHAYAANIKEKSGEIMLEIVKAFAHQVLAGRAFLCILCILLLITILCHIWKMDKGSWGKAALIITVVYVAYQMGNLCMYIFSMPSNQAVIMAGYERYYKTIIIWCFVYVMYLILNWANDIRVPFSWVLVLVSVLCFYQMGGNLSILKRETPTSTRAEIERMMQEYSMRHSEAYLVYIPYDDYGYTYHLTKYLLYTNTVDVHVTTDIEELREAVRIAKELGYTYFMNLDPGNEMIQAYCQEAFGVPAGTVVVEF